MHTFRCALYRWPRSLTLAVLLVPSLALVSSGKVHGSELRPVNLRCEHRTDPLGIDVARPRLGWELEAVRSATRGLVQAAYQILVASEPRRLRPGEADLWDSGEVASAETILVPYGGAAPLSAGQPCFWTVRVRTSSGGWSRWSAPGRWTMGPLGPADWSADWIGTGETFRREAGWPPPDKAPPDPWFRKAFVLESVPERALATVASVGYHELWVNGRKVGDAVLQPSVTDHSKRARYNVYDVASELQVGTNVVGLWLGTGWSIFPKFETADKPRAPIARAQLDLSWSDGRARRVATDATWHTRPSSSALLGVWDFMHFGGELQDANREDANWCAPESGEAGWSPVKVFHPQLRVSADPVEPNRPITEVRAVSVEAQDPGVYRIDMGRNFAGFVEMRLRGRPGDRVELQFSEQADRPMTHRLRSVCVLGPDGTGTFRNRFNYGIGRWITVTGLTRPPSTGDVRGWLVRTDYASAAAFECSNPRFNRIHDTARWTFENLSLGGYLVDCPHRERMGYGGDAHASTTMGLMNYRLGALYTKWAEDWRDAQGRGSAWGTGETAAVSGLEEGNLPYTAPTYWGGGGPGWCGYVVHLPAEMWEACGDRRLIEQMLPTIERWLGFLETRQREDLLRRWGGEWDFLGDWLWPGAKGVNGDTRETLFFNNCYWIYNLQTAARLARIAGRTDLADAWERRAEAVRRAVHAEFYVASEGSYVDGSQAYLAIALVAGVPPEAERSRVWARLEREIVEVRRGHIHAGITGGAFLFKALREANRDDLLALMVGQEGYPGWWDMLNQGATTFWESWENNPDLSYLHSSYLYVGAWFIQGVLGIQPDRQTGGFRRFIIRPGPLDRPDLTWARGHYDSASGRIGVDWRRKADRFELTTVIPPNTTAEVHLPTPPGAVVTERGRTLDRVEGIGRVALSGGHTVLSVPSGTYRFAVKSR